MVDFREERNGICWGEDATTAFDSACQSTEMLLDSHLFVFFNKSTGIKVRIMPKQITDIRDFLQKARRADAKLVKIRKRDAQTKFKIRCSRHLYTLVVTDSVKAAKLTHSLPPGLKKVTI
mmetsp:Transcript_34415/g.52817  ORF Transcript_34415/g.52817 Transcript_34415/m.52817 type:complete len:120 (-) Transcript_34415:162-521(-)|eukprot:CAMPEP_0118694840 /NCGR_PEP_ID=MMETSP0800-20121206/12793_1 /TAXON_ID=210618 ORGANISM="Striatella unipunctata, Strain CCMP2910" /NCGR_SAMPLE_ID=MMETSP0800 /ASSEMBLY_ACC=CAM_ASM_000638 /LENGTH=119 /DNA_ID=CAMNT_0006593443 /DNA_START=170 /DNA_END=529 /DNA_ORIENTATION=-